MTNRLPFEILTAIFEQVDVPDLRHVFATSRTFCKVATPNCVPHPFRDWHHRRKRP